MARSGTGAANLLARLGADVVVTDRKEERELSAFAGAVDPRVRLVLGGHPEEVFAGADLIVLSPGVPAGVPTIQHAAAKGIPVIGELELAYEIAARGLEDPPTAPLVREGSGGFLAVTGTNGKSTTTALLDFMMKKNGFRTILGGNIGNALTTEILGRMENPEPVDFIVAEVSSFQLETTAAFKPRVAAITNITPDHLDRYRDVEEYARAKARICERQGRGDVLVLNHDDPVTRRHYKEWLSGRDDAPTVFFFSRYETVRGVYARDGAVFCNFEGYGSHFGNCELIAEDAIRIKGVHNLENAMAASAMALLAGCDVDSVRAALGEFAGLEHRLEFVRELDGVRYFNDSKGTNVDAAMKSLESFPHSVLLIAGGRDKAGDFSRLREPVRQRVKLLVLIGEAREKMKNALGDLTETTFADDLRRAVEVCRERARPGDVVLLSPACASFDMFADFEDRGRRFKDIVRGLA